MEDESEPKGVRFRISVCLKRHFSDLRARCYVTVPATQHVKWLERRLRKLFSLPRDSDISLVCRGHLLPSDEPLTLLEPDDLVEVFPVQREGNDVVKVPRSEASRKRKSEKRLYDGVREVLPGQNAYSHRPSPASPTTRTPTNVQVIEVLEVGQAEPHQQSSTHDLSLIAHKELNNDRKRLVQDWKTETLSRKTSKKLKSQHKRKRSEHLYDETSEEFPILRRRRSSHHNFNEMQDRNTSKKCETLQKRQRLNQSNGDARNILPAPTQHPFPIASKALELPPDCKVLKPPEISQDSQHCTAETQDINVSNNIESHEIQDKEEHYPNEVSKASLPLCTHSSASSSSSTPDHSADYYVSNLHERQRKSRQHNDKHKTHLLSSEINKNRTVNKTAKDCTNDVAILNNSTDSEFHQNQKKVEYKHHAGLKGLLQGTDNASVLPSTYQVHKLQSHHKREKAHKRKQSELELIDEYKSRKMRNKCNSHSDSSLKQTRNMCLGDDINRMVSPISQLVPSSIVLPQATDLPVPLVERQEFQQQTEKHLNSSVNAPFEKAQSETQDKVSAQIPDPKTSKISLSENKQKIIKHISDDISEMSLQNTPSSTHEMIANCEVSKQTSEEKQDSHQVADDFTTQSLPVASTPLKKDENEITIEGTKETSEKSKYQPNIDIHKTLSPLSWRTTSSKPYSKCEELHEVKQRALQLLDELGSDTISPAMQGLQRKRRRRVRRRRKQLLPETYSATPWSTLPVEDESDRPAASVAYQRESSTASVENQCEMSTVPPIEQYEKALELISEQQCRNSPTTSEPRRCEMVPPPEAVIRNSSAGARAPRVVRSFSPQTKDKEEDERPPGWLKKVNFA